MNKETGLNLNIRGKYSITSLVGLSGLIFETVTLFQEKYVSDLRQLILGLTQKYTPPLYIYNEHTFQGHYQS